MTLRLLNHLVEKAVLKCHFVEYRLGRNRFSSITFDEIFYTHPAAVLYLLIMWLHVIVRLWTLAEITESEPDRRFYKGAREWDRRV